MVDYSVTIAVHLAVASDVFDGVFLCCPFSHERSWMSSGAELGQFLRVFLPFLVDLLQQLVCSGTVCI